MNDTAMQEIAGARVAGDEAHCLMAGLLQAARNVQMRLEQSLEAVSLTPAKYQALAVLVRADAPLALSELAGRLSCVKSNVTQLVDRLETDGLVCRVDDATDRRAIRAVITPLGLERQAAGAQAMAALQEEFRMRVGTEEQETFRRVLDVLR